MTDGAVQAEEARSRMYTELAAVGPYGADLGHALITMVEPHLGHEREYNRWYEDDHFIAGAMAMPWMYAGRRWVATRELQLLRYPEKSAVAQPVTAGCYISTYWITAGRYDDHMRWTVSINKRLNRDHRVFQGRTHIFTAFQDHVATIHRDGDRGPRDIHALDHPYAGLIVQVIDAESSDKRGELIAWLREGHLPKQLAGSPTAMVAIFTPTPLPLDRMTYVKPVEGVDTRVTLLWFLQSHPVDIWQDHFTSLDSAVSATGLGIVELVAPFIPTIPGTDRYTDELR
jgi:hypothetical protein